MPWHEVLLDLLHRYGYVFICLIILFESMGAPLPGESLLIAASLYAASTHKLAIELVAGSAAIGAILGDNFGYLIGHLIGTRLLVRYGRHVGLTEKRLRLGQYLFRQHGGKVVFFGRFMALLRTFAALLAGANGMHWKDFLIYNALGGIAWSCFYSFGPYLLGDAAKKIAGPFGFVLAAVAVIVIVWAIWFFKKNEHRLEQEAEAAMADH